MELEIDQSSSKGASQEGGRAAKLMRPGDCAFAVPPIASSDDPGRQEWILKAETFIVNHRSLMAALHWTMIVLYLSLILIPPLMPRPAENASPFNNYTMFSLFAFWYIWWPMVVLSMLLFGRAWCGFLCPEGALSAYASNYGGNRPVPRWMQMGGIPLFAFVGITLYGQLIGVYEYPEAQLLILGGSTLLACAVALIYTRKGWVWCRYLCPISLLLGVFSRLGALHFKVDREKLAASEGGDGRQADKEPCPVFIYLPKMSTNRYCLMCTRCANWRGAIHLSLRKPGYELENIDRSQPLFWEVIFLFGAIGLPLGVFRWSIDPLFISLKQAIGGAMLSFGLGPIIGWSGPWWLMSNHPELGEVFNLLDAITIAAFIVGAVALSISLFYFLTWASAVILMGGSKNRVRLKELITQIGYLYTPISLFSLFLGLSQLTFGHLGKLGLSNAFIFGFRGALLAAGIVWSLYLAYRIMALYEASGRRLQAIVPHFIGISLIVLGWYPVLF